MNEMEAKNLLDNLIGMIDDNHSNDYDTVLKMAIKALEEISLYKQGGLCLVPTDVYEKQCKQLDEYKELGTVEELREAREKQIPKKVIWEQGVCYAMTKDGKERHEMIPKCPSCLSLELIYSYPCKCGQRLDWSE